VAVDYFEDVMPRGPAGCTRDAAMAAGNSATEYVVAEGTILPHLDLESLVESHRDSGAALTVVVGDNGEASGSCNGILEPVGIYVFSASAVKHVPENGYQDIKERLIPQLYKAGEKIVPFGVRRDRVPRVTNPATYLLLNQREIERLASGHRTPSDYHRRQEAWIHSSAQVAASARFVGPVMVGPGTVIEDDVVVVGPTSIGSGCHIGARSVVSRSTLWRGAAIGPAAQLDRCIVADDAEVETATVARDMLLVNVTSASLGLVARLFSRRFNGRSGARRITYAVSLEV
jgi:mannose-1-phosphate guanylyltransferase